MKYVISRLSVNLPGYEQVFTPQDLRKVAKGSEVYTVGPIPFNFLEKDILLQIAQENRLSLRAINVRS